MDHRKVLGRAWRKYRSWPIWVQAIIALVALSIVVGPFVGEDETTTAPTGSDERTAENRTVESQEDEGGEVASPEEDLRASVQEALGESNRDAERIGTFGAKPGGEVHIKWTIDENLTEGLTKDTLRLEATEILEAVSKSSFRFRTVLLEGTFPLVDKFGNESEEIVVRAVFTRNVVERINYENIAFKSILDLAGSSSVHPAFQY
jgi:hypothetical protein